MDGTILAYISFVIFHCRCTESGVCRAWHIIEYKINGKSEPTASEWCSRRRWDIRSISHTHSHPAELPKIVRIRISRARCTRLYIRGSNSWSGCHTHIHMNSHPDRTASLSVFPHRIFLMNSMRTGRTPSCTFTSAARLLYMQYLCFVNSILFYRFNLFSFRQHHFCAPSCLVVFVFFFYCFVVVVYLRLGSRAVVFPTCAVHFDWQTFVDCDALQ